MFSVKDDSLWRTEQQRNGPGYSKHGVRFVNRPAMIGQGIANGLKVVEQRISLFKRLVHHRDGIQKESSLHPRLNTSNTSVRDLEFPCGEK